MTPGDVEVHRFDPEPVSARTVRRLVEAAVSDRHGGRVLDDALLCADELAANAVLHARAPFDVALRPLDDGIRIDVIDPRPGEVPVMVPPDGTAADITAQALTGRGLQIVSAIATRWGVSTSAFSKSVWAECTAKAARGAAPVLELAYAPRLGETVRVDLLSLPVRAAVGSGVQVDNVVREAQIGLGRTRLDAGLRRRLFDLLDASAVPRLAGRHAALRASAAFEERFDLIIDSPPAALAATSRLAAVLVEVADQLGAESLRVAPAVRGFREWLDAEALAQRQGAPPSPCPLPSD